MESVWWYMVAAALPASLLLTAVLRRFALAHNLLDVPNARSSHERPTPRGGGAAIVLVTSVAVLALMLADRLDGGLAIALLGGGLLIAGLGFLDDRYSLPASVRLATHIAAAVTALIALDGLPAVAFGPWQMSPGWIGLVLGTMAIVWALNLFNFMDGIDGLAASEAAFITAAAGLFAVARDGLGGGPLAALVLAAACVGFLCWNWPPARIFMGDVGSGYIGYVVAILAIGELRHDAAGLWTWLILGGVFFADATLTLGRRLLRQESLHTAHRSHAYQHLARRWRSHRRVTLVVLAINLAWLLPAAWLAQRYPQYAAVTAAGALLPLFAGAALIGAGRVENAPDSALSRDGDSNPKNGATN
jgi:Fuc2NAc and GlcNAc transferase